jgi:LuxR family quorum-sensing system transcriptional regulator CciR
MNDIERRGLMLSTLAPDMVPCACLTGPINTEAVRDPAIVPNIHAGSGATGGIDMLEFIESCNRAATPEHIFNIFRGAAERLGYDRVALAAVTPPARHTLGLTVSSPAITANVPEEWIQHYTANGYEVFDPVMLRTPQSAEPLVWDNLTRETSLSPKQRRVMAESRDAGLLNGVSIPLHGPRGETYVVSLATHSALLTQATDLAKLHILAVQFMISYARQRRGANGASSTRLTDRERECLTWTARGKSAWSIGKILGVSEHTVNFHLKRAMAKLEAANRMQAVVAALRLGLILP